MYFSKLKPVFIACLMALLSACATPAPSVSSSEYNSKTMATQLRKNGHIGAQNPVKQPAKVSTNVNGKVFYIVPPPNEEGAAGLQDQDSEVNNNRHGYPVYDPNDDNPYVYTPPTPTNYPADNDADYYYYPLYYGE